MPPFLRKKFSASTSSRSENNNVSSSTGSSKQQLQKVRKSARLIGMVNGLQKSMEATIDSRKYFAQRSLDLEHALTESAPEALTKSITMRTIQVADIMMELENLTENNATFEERIRILQHGHERGTQNLQAQLDQLQIEYNLLEERAHAKQNELEEKLKDATEETEELQKKYFNMRQSFHSCTKNIAIMASKIASVQRENSSLRLEVEESHQVLIDMEKKVKFLRERERQILLESITVEAQESGDTITVLQSQLEAVSFENDKLVAERTAHQSVIEELQNPAKELMSSVDGQIRRLSMGSSVTADTGTNDHTAPTSTTDIMSISVSTTNDSPKQTEQHQTRNQESKFDGSLNIVELSAMPSNESKVQVFEDLSVDTPPRAKKETRAQIEKDAPKRVRRMKVSINGLDGAYTGPLGSNGLPNGTGTIRFKNGDTYLGDLRDGQLHGKGAMYFGDKDKTTLRGQFESNALVE
jgi:hypothetical protein